ncbi:acyloxyacyl hydrolase [Roseobacter sp. SK209-2-6]|uniref:acyloxyacyl hydrolase n=1 Tax=Roseobacter sp. SK209-2-6 TaxID=388739 RepID=UPI00055C3643|nr:acyloxyacyl hydrolase [Roseobacter sp. SK209-2-6]
MRRLLSAAAIALATAAPAMSQEIIFGAGYSDYSLAGAEDGAVFSVEYLHSPFHEHSRFSARFGGVLELVSTGDAFVGVGLSGNLDLNNDWFVETSVMPGAYFENAPLNDLGSTFEIRSQIALGKRLRNGTALSLALSHKSNASTASLNPGVNVLSLRWHKPL